MSTTAKIAAGIGIILLIPALANPALLYVALPIAGVVVLGIVGSKALYDWEKNKRMGSKQSYDVSVGDRGGDGGGGSR